jgi:REP element-mobilizing transposase RayT
MEGYKHSRSSVGSNMKHVQITPKYRYKMMRQEKLKVFCRVAIEEACQRHNIENFDLSYFYQNSLREL